MVDMAKKMLPAANWRTGTEVAEARTREIIKIRVRPLRAWGQAGGGGGGVGSGGVGLGWKGRVGGRLAKGYSTHKWCSRSSRSGHSVCSLGTGRGPRGSSLRVRHGKGRQGGTECGLSKLSRAACKPTHIAGLVVARARSCAAPPCPAAAAAPPNGATLLTCVPAAPVSRPAPHPSCACGCPPAVPCANDAADVHRCGRRAARWAGEAPGGTGRKEGPGGGRRGAACMGKALRGVGRVLVTA